MVTTFREHFVSKISYDFRNQNKSLLFQTVLKFKKLVTNSSAIGNRIVRGAEKSSKTDLNAVHVKHSTR